MERDPQSLPWLRRLPRYIYLADLLKGKRILELDSGCGRGAVFLADHGAAHVVGADPSLEAVQEASKRHNRTNLEFRCEKYEAMELEDGSVDCVIVPDGERSLRHAETLVELRRVLREDGYLVLSARSADRVSAEGGISFFEFSERLASMFSPVRMVAESPFLATSLVEYCDNDTEPEVELDTSLLDLDDKADMDVSGYVAICGGQDAPPRGFTVIQVPTTLGIQAMLAPQEMPEKAVRPEESPAIVARLRDREEEARRHANELQSRLEQAQLEVGRVAGQAAIELAEARKRVATLEQQVGELQKQEQSVVPGPPTIQVIEDISYEEVVVELPGEHSGEAETTLELDPGQAGEQDSYSEEPTTEFSTGKLADLSEDKSPSEFDSDPTRERGRSVSEQITQALEVHAEELQKVEAQLSERNTYVEELRQDLRMALEEAGQARGKAAAAEQRTESLKAELAEWRDRASVAEGKVLRLDGAVEDAKSLRERAESLGEELREVTHKLNRVTESWQQAEDKSDEVWKRVGELQGELEKQLQEFSSTSSELAAVKEKLSHEQRERAADTQASNEKVQLLEDSCSQLQKHQQELQAAKDQLESRIEESATMRADLEERKQELETRLQESETSRADLEERKQELETRLQESETSRADLEQSNQELEERLREVATSRAELEARMQKMTAALEEMEDKVRASEAHNEALTHALDIADGRLDNGDSEPAVRSDATGRLQALRGKADSIEQELAASRALLAELEQGVSQLSNANGNFGEEMPAAFSAQERVRRLAIELGVKEAEMTLLNLGVSTLQQRLQSVVELVQRTRDTLGGCSATEMQAAVDGLVRSVVAFAEGSQQGS